MSKRLLILLFIIHIGCLIPNRIAAQTHIFVAQDTNNSFTGSNTFSGPVTAANFNNRLLASTFAGADICAKMMAAYNFGIAANSMAIIDISDLEGVQPACAAGLNFGTSNVTVLQGYSTIQLGTNQIIHNGTPSSGALNWYGVPVFSIGAVVGSQISYSGTAAAIDLGDGVNATYNHVISGLLINAVGNATSSATAIGIRARNCRYCLFTNTSVQNFAAGEGREFRGVGGTFDATNQLWFPMDFNNLVAIYTVGVNSSQGENDLKIVGGFCVGPGAAVANSACLKADVNTDTLKVYGYDAESALNCLLIMSTANNSGLFGVRTEFCGTHINVQSGAVNTYISGHEAEGTGTFYTDAGTDSVNTSVYAGSSPFGWLARGGSAGFPSYSFGGALAGAQTSGMYYTANALNFAQGGSRVGFFDQGGVGQRLGTGTLYLGVFTAGDTCLNRKNGSPGVTIFGGASCTNADNGGTAEAAAYNTSTGHLLISGTAPTIAAAGCGGSAASIASNNGTAAFTINVGTTPTSGGCTVTLPTAATAWACFVTDITTNSTSVFLQKQTGGSQTTAVLQNFSDVAVATAPTASDIWRVSCEAY